MRAERTEARPDAMLALALEEQADADAERAELEDERRCALEDERRCALEAVVVVASDATERRSLEAIAAKDRALETDTASED